MVLKFFLITVASAKTVGFLTALAFFFERTAATAGAARLIFVAAGWTLKHRKKTKKLRDLWGL